MSKFFSAAAALIATAALATGALAPAAMAKADPKRVQSEQDDSQASMKQKYCVKDAFTGSRIRKLVCLTRGQWIAQTGEDPAQLEKK
ncbi:hypothetical protein AB2M62_11035 [Sphingomonas sp. MMS12-HWE2-04]|uniref:hypothetical protein n=1 Tax=Sphingomonas sp. MMS12-HWE2-04 TaxID=3234199 RepID=UPI0038512636